MTTLYLSIERDLMSRSSREGARFRVRVAAQPNGLALLTSTRLMQSVTKAKGEAAMLFGDLEWTDATTPGEVRATSVLEIE